MRFILISVICLTASVAVAVDNLLPPVGTEWKTARNAAAQAAFKISKLGDIPAFYVGISSDSGMPITGLSRNWLRENILFRFAPPGHPNRDCRRRSTVLMQKIFPGRFFFSRRPPE